MDIVGAQPGSPQTSKMESFATIFNGFVNYCCNALYSILDVCGGPGYTSGTPLQYEQSATKKKSVIQKVQCNKKTFRCIKVQHETVQYIKRVPREKIQNENCAI